MRYCLQKIILFNLLLLVPYLGASAQGSAEEMYLEELLNARHLPKYMLKDKEAGLSELVNNPASYLTLIDNELVFPTINELSTYSEFRFRYGRLLGLLETIGSEEARQVLERAYGEVADDMEYLIESYENALSLGIDEQQRLVVSRNADAAYSLFVDIIYIFKRLGDDRVLEDALSRYERLHYVAQLAISQYNAEVGEGEIANASVGIVAGWQMVGMPLNPLNQGYVSVYKDIALDGAPWTWTSTGYEQATDLAMGNAYWINAQAPGEQSIFGIENVSITIPGLDAGWSNLSGPSCDYPVADLIANHSEIDGSIMYAWQPENGYVRLEEGELISQGNAFWVFLESAATLTLTCPESGATSSKSPAAIAAFKPVENGFRSIMVSDSQGRRRSLYFGNQVPETIQASFALPPLPPPGSFDVRFADGGTLVEGTSTMEVQLSTDQYPVTINLDQQIEGEWIVEEIASGQVIASQVLGDGRSVEIVNPSVSVLRIRLQ